jgi:hypothetical protein
LPRFSIGQTGPSANGKINVACIGIGNRGFFAVSELMKDPRVNLVAFADVDQVLVEETQKRGAELKKTAEAHVRRSDDGPVFRDYREMFAKMGDKIDAVTVSTPDHHHYPAAMMAIQRGNTSTWKSRSRIPSDKLARCVTPPRRKGVITQMGNQGPRDGRHPLDQGMDRRWRARRRARSACVVTRVFRALLQAPGLAAAGETNSAVHADWDLWLGPSEPRPYNELLAP